MKIDPHDIEIRLKQARKFLRDGHKVQIVQNFRGREMIHRERGTERMQQIIEDLGDISKVEAPPRQTGRRMTMILAPDKRKIEQIKRREAADRESDQDTPAAPPEHEESTSGGEQTKPQAQSEDRTEERSSETVEARHS
jgi:translation initiation factor IF-3